MIIQAQCNVIEKLTKLVPVDHEDLLNITLRLLLNLSFDNDQRSKMVKYGMLPKLVALLSKSLLLEIYSCVILSDSCTAVYNC